ncbi:MAG: hypothetical protein WD294_04785 [Phycisphaeraceae bacterium]
MAKKIDDKATGRKPHARRRAGRGVRVTDSEKAADSIEQFYEVGRQSLEDHPGRFHSGEAAKAAKKTGLTATMLGRARKFADPDRGYTPEQLEHLVKTCRKGPHPVTREHVVRLLSLSKGDRRRIAKRIADEGWTTIRLNEEIKRLPRKDGAPRRGGRTPKPLRDRGELLVQLRLRLEKWQAWHAWVKSPPAEEEQVTIAALPKPLRDQLEVVDKATTKALKIVEKEVKRL